MTIARNPRRALKEKKVEKFINAKNGIIPARDLVPVVINFDRDLLERVTAGARRMGLNRSAFIVSAAAEKLGRQASDA